MPAVERLGQLDANGLVERLETIVHEWQPRMKPRMDRHRVRERIPGFDFAMKHMKDQVIENVVTDPLG